MPIQFPAMGAYAEVQIPGKSIWECDLPKRLLFLLLQVMYKHWLPNFNECWWDALVLDFLLCNGLGESMWGAINNDTWGLLCGAHTEDWYTVLHESIQQHGG